jgi:hypothetical protein
MPATDVLYRVDGGEELHDVLDPENELTSETAAEVLDIAAAALSDAAGREGMDDPQAWVEPFARLADAMLAHLSYEDRAVVLHAAAIGAASPDADHRELLARAQALAGHVWDLLDETSDAPLAGTAWERLDGIGDD